MKRKLYIFTSKNPDLPWWVEKVSREIWYWFNKTWNYDVSFVFPWEESKTENKNWINYISIKNSINVPFFSDIFLNIKLISLFQKLKCDDIVVNNFASPLLYLLLNRKQFKLVQIAHCCMYCSSLSVKKRWLVFFKKWLNIIYNRWCDLMIRPVIKRADLIITLSKYLKEELVRYYHINPNKIEIIYNWCDTNSSKLESHNEKSPLKVSFIWSNYGWKWFNILEWVAKKMDWENIEFNVIWADSYIPKSKNIKSLWRIKREDVYRSMSKSDVIFLPSHYEGQPLVILEWMSFGCIPVCSKTCHMDMLEMTEFKKFISEKNSVDDYVEIFRKLLVSDHINDLRKQSKKTVSEYTWDNQIKEYINLFDRL